MLTYVKDPSVGEHLLLGVDWFCSKTFVFRRNDGQSCLISGRSKE